MSGVSKTRCWVLWLLGGLSLAVAQLPAHAETRAERWQRMDQAAVRLILDGEYKEARKTLDRVLTGMKRHMGRGIGAEQALGLVLMHRALAEAGLGKRHLALWDWHSALNFNPALRTEDLGRFGPPGELLAQNPLRPLSSDDRAEAASPPPVSLDEPDVKPPERRKSPRPRYSIGARIAKIEGLLIIQGVITEEGDLVHPLVLLGPDFPTLTYSVLETLREWKFWPALLNGEPVPVWYNLSVNLRLRH